MTRVPERNPQPMHFRPLPLLTFFTLLSLAILLWLGQWQYGRYSEKLDGDVAPGLPVERVSVEIDTAVEPLIQSVYGIADGEAVWRHYAPGRIAGTGEQVMAMVGASGGPRPRVPETVPDRIDYEAARVFERTTSRKSGRNRPEENTWYVFDADGMLDRWGLNADRAPAVEPVEMTVIAADDPARRRVTRNPYAAPQPIDPLPPARHFGYALTWWGLALALLGVYFAYHHSRGRLSFRSKR
mgnify:CR=1 FL=1